MVESIKQLRKICYRNSDKKRPLYMELFTMKISIYVTKLLLYTPVHADQVTISMVLLAVIGSGMMAFGSIPAMFIGITLIHFTVVLDNVNGEIARYRKEGSLTGTFLEELYHTVSIPFIFFSLGYGVFSHTGAKSAIIFGFLAAIFAYPIVLTSIKTAVVKKGMDRLEGKKGMLPKKYTMLNSGINVKGGSTKTGRELYSLYSKLREVWGFPFNVLHIQLVLALELMNYYLGFMPAFLLPLAYIIIYGSVSVIRQIISFIVHYNGKTVFHYYNALFDKK